MNNVSLPYIFIDALLINNFVLSVFLGLCPFIGVSGRFDTASRMGIAVIFVMLISSAVAFGINKILIATGTEYLRIISYIVVIASMVQLVEMFLKKTSPTIFRAMGIYLPLITTNCAVLGVAMQQTRREYDFAHAIVYTLGSGLGFALALVVMSTIRERLELADIPGVARGTALVLMIAGILSMAFMGFAGLGG
ncbi:MAG TPA: RnfABCDGE type electron transport complex subunit A [Candidatus Hydrogenedentes bacterium]|nr:RnfABCDGE type electron transport complex subunit A [Candidatus Hydrogenedentota bacterium]HOL76908.1 RnfABCDGE type electron transport complex subunit A [Candidatus Hydrogenedentota bacterium]HPO85560.1 RnfABCDGE type electron transport complex subunit A [Candidatus Hydrogenedentota bacterium]